MASTIKVNTIQNTCGADIIKESGNTITIGASGDTVTLASGASQSGFGRTGTVDWQTSSIKTGDFTAVNGQGFFVDTSSGAVTATLPAGAAGSIVAFSDYTNTFQNNAFTITPNGSDKIGGTNASASVAVEGVAVTLVFVDSTEGWKLINDATTSVIGETFMSASGGTESTSPCGNFKIHKFTGPGTFTVSSIGNLDKNNTVSYVVVGGGGGGMSMIQNNSQGGGGGGAGGYRENKSPVDTYTASPVEGSTDVIVTATAFPITVGAGGTGSGNFPVASNPGSASIFSTITSAGGGGVAGSCSGTGATGGSGGGGSANCGAGGAGNTPSVSPAQGNTGGDGYNRAGNPSAKYGAGGGGGATGTGSDGHGSGAPANSGKGGLGATSSITASPVLYAEGGGGANYCMPTSPPGLSQGSGGNAGYGPYPNGPNMSGQAGTVNTGGGGGGGSNANSGGPTANGGAGGSGIVIIRYRFQ